MIELVNLKNIKPSLPYDVRIDRTSILGNPFHLGRGRSRDEVCDLYQDYFKAKVLINENFKCEVFKLFEIYRQYGQLRLFCWCVPHRCHGETIKDFLLKQGQL